MRLPNLLRLVMVFILMKAGGQELELAGRIDPAPRRASVTIYGATSPFAASTFTDSKGRFRFRKLAPGSYTVSVFVPGMGEVRRTVAVTPTLAGSKGQVTVTIPFAPSGEASARSIERRHTVSTRELSIPDRARREYEEAQKRLGRRDVEGAIQRLERAVELAPQFVAAWNNLGTIAYQSGDYAKAASYFRRALEQQPGAFEPAVNLGGALLSLGQFEEALKYNLYAVGERPEDALANSQLGMNYFFLAKPDAAVKHLVAAKRADPAHFSHPQLVLAEIYLRRRDRAAAVRELEDFLARHPDAPNAEKVRRQVEQLR